MKKIILILAIVGYAMYGHASASSKTSIIKLDSAGVSRKLNDLNSKLADLKNQLTGYQNQLPVDSAKYQDLLSKSLDEQKKSKDYAKDAVGGDVSDAKKAAKQAKKAADATDDANDAKKKI
ncbi:MAG: hypothetical protein JO080_12070 [Mucilaginibacter sp.]|nr:hypothetical protein [Mucilaginibacter sp.]